MPPIFYGATARLSLARSAYRRGEGNAPSATWAPAYVNLGEPRRAIDLYEQRLAIAREIGDHTGEAEANWNLGLVYEAEGELRRAVSLMELCVEYERGIGHPDAEKDAARVEALRARLGGPPAPGPRTVCRPRSRRPRG